MKKDLKETFRTRAFYVSLGLVIFVMVMLGAEIGKGVTALAEEGNTAAIQALLGTLAFMLALMLMMLFCMYINAYTLTMEKVKRSIESLLCTPLSLKQICLGKSMAIFLPSLLLGWLFTFIGIILLNFIFISPQLGNFVMPGAAPLVAVLVIVPFIFFFLSVLVIILQLILTNIRWVNAILMGLFFGVGFGLSPFLEFGPASWNIVYGSLGIAAALALIIFFLFPLVSKEKIVLSSKG